MRGTGAERVRDAADARRGFSLPRTTISHPVFLPDAANEKTKPGPTLCPKRLWPSRIHAQPGHVPRPFRAFRGKILSPKESTSAVETPTVDSVDNPRKSAEINASSGV